jgi:signal transduction histidine kinase
VRDVTEQNRLQFQLEQADKLAAIGELAAGVAHEINNPIATLDIQTGLMRDILRDAREKPDGKLFEEIEEYLNIVEDQAQRCHSVTSSLLSFSRSPESKKESFDINDLLKKTVKLVTNLTGKEPAVELLLDERLSLFLGDPNRLGQVFINLLNNALKAIPHRGSITIGTRLDPDGGIRIEFKDSGPGIAPETKPRIFDPFFTTDPEGGGTGLGLSISHYIIKEMNGNLEVESSPGQGAVFTITLRCQDKAEEDTGHVS